ncbi:hydroxymethylglutaryl-CoA reductase [Parapedobacter tibetensis]|uniref:hydroxymethylglutaryl-CoA reductase n=1 Tax=Parapedobacter tibetensis TaxID=2972951 RepID=UPI00214D5F1D|nr:hydroxymethylglutaryl-CoA reductase [Parapedobacter tibetensis]
MKSITENKEALQRKYLAMIAQFSSHQDEVKAMPPKEFRLKIDDHVDAKGSADRLAMLQEETGKNLIFLSKQDQLVDLGLLEGHIENYIGMTAVPTGVVGPLRVAGIEAKGDFYVPLATTEGALVASFHRGAKVCYLAGGASSVCTNEAVQRCPAFKFENLADLGQFLAWVLPNLNTFQEITVKTSRYAQLLDIKANIEGNHLTLVFEYYTGDASGQNMVTLCTDAICQHIVANSPIKPVAWYIESNYSGDKKATALSFTHVRGKKVTSEIVLPAILVENVLKTTSQAMDDYWRTSTIGVIQSGAIGAQGHYANGLAALFLATGQDVACVAEAATGITRMECNTDGSLYASITLPNLIVGTVGGGTTLPTQRECLELMDCYGTGKANKFAEICGALLLAGELSIAAALSAGHFTSAHRDLGRKKS